jgi:hypothetical protein
MESRGRTLPGVARTRAHRIAHPVRWTHILRCASALAWYILRRRSYAGRCRGAAHIERIHNKPLRLFSYQTKERLHYTHGPRSSRVPRPASATLCAAAQRRNCRGNANTARGKDAQHNMLGNFAAGRFFESLEPSQHCGASNNARVQAPCQPSPWVDRTHLFEMPCAAKLFEYGF